MPQKKPARRETATTAETTLRTRKHIALRSADESRDTRGKDCGLSCQSRASREPLSLPRAQRSAAFGDKAVSPRASGQFTKAHWTRCEFFFPRAKKPCRIWTNSRTAKKCQAAYRHGTRACGASMAMCRLLRSRKQVLRGPAVAAGQQTAITHLDTVDGNVDNMKKKWIDRLHLRAITYITQ